MAGELKIISKFSDFQTDQTSAFQTYPYQNKQAIEPRVLPLRILRFKELLKISSLISHSDRKSKHFKSLSNSQALTSRRLDFYMTPAIPLFVFMFLLWQLILSQICQKIFLKNLFSNIKRQKFLFFRFKLKFVPCLIFCMSSLTFSRLSLFSSYEPDPKAQPKVDYEVRI